MKLGILNACTPADEDEFQVKEFHIFTNFFAQVDHNFALTEYRITEGQFPQGADECDAYLITGSPKGVYDNDDWIGQLDHYIRDFYAAGHTLVGICFGHQILAHALGGQAKKSPKGWGMGPSIIEVTQSQPWMTPPLPTGNFYFCHQDQVTSLPQHAELLAGNEFCPNGMFTIGNQVLGLQAHPEFTTDIMVTAIDSLSKVVEPTVIDNAISTTAQRQVDNAIMAQWIVNFLVGSQQSVLALSQTKTKVAF